MREKAIAPIEIDDAVVLESIAEFAANDEHESDKMIVVMRAAPRVIMEKSVET